MTKTEARKLARRARQYGYFDSGRGEFGGREIYVFCPKCRERVDTLYNRLYGTLNEHLDRAMVDHLLHDCETVAKFGA